MQQPKQLNTQPTRTSLSGTTEVSYDVVIIGAGLSGLVAAFEINKKMPDCTICLVDAHKRCGGQIKSRDEGELGARWISVEQRNVGALCDELGIQLMPRSGCEHAADELDQQAGAMQRDWDIDGGCWAPLAHFELDRYLRYVTMRSRDFGPGQYALSKSPVPMETFICQQLFFESSRNVARLLVRFACGCDASEVSVREYLAVCHGTHGVQNQLNSLMGNGDQLCFEPNAYAMIKALLEILKKSPAITFRLNTKVRVLCNFEHTIFMLCAPSAKIVAKSVIVAIPLQEVERISFGPSRPVELRIPNPCKRHMISSFVLNFTQPFWRKEFHSGSVMHFTPLPMIMYETGESTLCGMLFHNEQPEDFDPVAQIVMPWLFARFECAASQPVSTRFKIWEQAVIRGLPPTSVWQHIVWASSNAGTLWRGHLNGAVQSGVRAACLALLRVKPELVQWDDIARVHNQNEVRSRRAGAVESWMASCNLYGCSRCVMLCGAAYVIYRKWDAIMGVFVPGNASVG